jgi:hypothetical protein
MRTRHAWNLLASIVLVTAFAEDGFASNCVVIDDFTTGRTQLRIADLNTWVMDTQTGSMLGGWRTAALLTTLNPYRHLAQLTIKNPKEAVVGTFPLQGISRAEIIYGQGVPGANVGGTVPPLAYYPTGCDRFRVHFNAAAAYNYINFNVLAWYQDGYPYYAQLGINMLPFGQPFNFCVDFPFSHFVTTGGYGPAEITLPGRGIRAVDFILQSGGAGGAEQFAISRIETLDAATAATSPCSIVA